MTRLNRWVGWPVCLCCTHSFGERGGSVVECRTPEREVRGSRPTAAVLCPWARHFTPRKYWLITQEAMAPSRYDWKIVDWDVKPQHNQPTNTQLSVDFAVFWLVTSFSTLSMAWFVIKLAMSWENLFLPYANNKGADQLAHLRSLISNCIVCYLDSIILIIAVATSSRF